MTPAAIIEQATADGVDLIVSSDGTVIVSGEQNAMNRWLPILRLQKAGIVDTFAHAAAEASLWLDLESRANKCIGKMVAGLKTNRTISDVRGNDQYVTADAPSKEK